MGFEALYSQNNRGSSTYTNLLELSVWYPGLLFTNAPFLLSKGISNGVAFVHATNAIAVFGVMVALGVVTAVWYDTSGSGLSSTLYQLLRTTYANDLRLLMTAVTYYPYQRSHATNACGLALYQRSSTINPSGLALSQRLRTVYATSLVLSIPAAEQYNISGVLLLLCQLLLLQHRSGTMTVVCYCTMAVVCCCTVTVVCYCTTTVVYYCTSAGLLRSQRAGVLIGACATRTDRSQGNIVPATTICNAIAWEEYRKQTPSVAKRALLFLCMLRTQWGFETLAHQVGTTTSMRLKMTVKSLRGPTRSPLQD